MSASENTPRTHSNKTENVVQQAEEIRRILDRRDVLQRKLFESQYETLFMLAFSVDKKEGRFGLDTLATGLLSRHLAEEVKLSSSETRFMALAAPLHDIGKIAFPEEMLQKTTQWSEADWVTYRNHTCAGANILHPFKQNPIMALAEKIARHHHENWDGTGFPDRLAGEDIPVAARIVAVVDGYLSHATYRSSANKIIQGIPIEVAIEDIRKKSNTRYDPEIVEAFIQQMPKIAKEYAMLLESKDNLMQHLSRVASSLCADGVDFVFQKEE